MHGIGFSVIGVLAAMLGLVREAQAGPAIATRWQEASITQDDCLKRAEDAIGRTGFGKLERTGQSRFGSVDDYTAAVRCVTSRGIVFFIVSGPARSQADGMAGILFQNFDAKPK
jgi:hypothetical protein